jgi:hypothetical protein
MFSSSEDQATARHYIERLRAHDFDEIEKAMDPSIEGPTLRATLEQMYGSIPAADPVSVQLVGAQTIRSSGSTTVNTTFEFDFDGHWFLINAAIKTKNGAKTIVGLNVAPETRSLADQNRFGLSGKSLAQLSVLGAAIAAALFSLWALVVCIRSRLPGRKWPWVLFIILGIGELWVNWNTGAWGVDPIAVQLFSASAMSSPSGAWLVSVSLPLGAIVFLIYRKARLATPAASAPRA